MEDTSLVSEQRQAAFQIPSSAKLPQIELPKFDGNYLQWRQFHDLFLELVHNSSLPTCQKMIFLKSSLNGEARSLISHFTTAAVNYNAAWNVLIDRYENKRILVNALLSKLLHQPYSNTETASSLKLLRDITYECLLSLRGLNILTDHWDPLLLHLLVQRLSKTSHSLWEQSLSNPKDLPSLTEFLNFLKNRFQSLEALQANSMQASTTYNAKKVIGASTTVNSKCVICDNNHNIYNCSTFLSMTPTQRLKSIQKAKRCVNCLKVGHNAKACNSSKCTKCHKKHNTLLHLGNNEVTSDTNGNISSQITTTMTSASGSMSSSAVLLSTAHVYVTDTAGNKHACRALLDSGSQANFMTNRLANKLGLKTSNQIIEVEGIGQTQSKTKGRINVEMTSIVNGFTKRIEVHLLSNIVSPQPSQTLDTSKWRIPSNIILSDKNFAQPGNIDLLIGAGLFYSILAVGQISLGSGHPVLQNTFSTKYRED